MAVSSEQWRQYVSALCVLCVAVFLGLPTWWRTTEVYRCPLPYREISQLASQQVGSVDDAEPFVRECDLPSGATLSRPSNLDCCPRQGWKGEGGGGVLLSSTE